MVKSLSEIKTEEGRNLDSSLADSTLVAGEGANFGAFSLSALWNFIKGKFTNTVEANNMNAVTSNAVKAELDSNYYNKQSVDVQINNAFLNVSYEDITSECYPRASSIVVNHVYAYRQGNRVTLTFDVTTESATYAIVKIPQRYTPRSEDFSRQWWHYSISNKECIATVNNASDFYVLYDNSLPSGINFIQSFDYYI